jgi:prevent-host-death family protein
MVMSNIVDALDPETNLLELLDRAEKGETITITRHGKPVARLVPADDEAARARRRAAIEKLKEFGKRHTLGEGLTVKDLINEGRRF